MREINFKIKITYYKIYNQCNIIGIIKFSPTTRDIKMNYKTTLCDDVMKKQILLMLFRLTIKKL